MVKKIASRTQEITDERGGKKPMVGELCVVGWKPEEMSVAEFKAVMRDFTQVVNAQAAVIRKRYRKYKRWLDIDCFVE